MNYVQSFIAVADDCKVTAAKVPAPRGKKKTLAEIQYEMLAEHPFTYTQEDVLFNSWMVRQDLGDLSADEVAEARRQFFAKGRPCLRTSPLTRTHGWGLVFDVEGRVALCPMESSEYAAYLADGSLKKIKALSSKRGS